MDSNIKLTLKKSLIIEAVKGETYIKGRIDNAAAPDGKAHLLAYEEEAGNEEFHERKLQRTMFTALSELKGVLADYVHPINATSGDNITIDSKEGSDDIIINLVVSDRFNQAQVTPLAHLCAKYVEDNMLTQWWGAFNQNQAQFYAGQMQLDMNSISICFNKLAPAVPSYHYPTVVHPVGPDYNFTSRVKEDFTITYGTDAECTDDVECVVNNPYIASVVRVPDDTKFKIVARHTGVTTYKVFSRHDETKSFSGSITVTE